MKYYNEMVLEILNTPENEDFAKKTASLFANHMNIDENGFATIEKMVEEVFDDFKVKYGEGQSWIILKMKIDGMDVIVEIDKKKSDW